MGNELCDTVQKYPEHKRNNLVQSMSPGNQGDKDCTSSSLCRTNTQTLHQKELIKISYGENLVQCRSDYLKYYKAQDGVSQFPVINGLVKVYSKKDEQQLVFEGQLRNSKFNGYGKLYKLGKLVYEGQFKNDLFDGWGITSQYTGQFRQGLYDGYGIYREFQAQDQQFITFYYEGYFQNGLYSGSGVLIKGAKLIASHVDNIHNSHGIFQFLNDQIERGMEIIKMNTAKQIYIGQFSNGFRHGFGRLFTEKFEFSGQFSHNLFHGIGTVYNHTKQGKSVVQTVFKMGKQYKS